MPVVIPVDDHRGHFTYTYTYASARASERERQKTRQLTTSVLRAPKMTSLFGVGNPFSTQVGQKIGKCTFIRISRFSDTSS